MNLSKFDKLRTKFITEAAEELGIDINALVDLAKQKQEEYQASLVNIELDLDSETIAIAVELGQRHDLTFSETLEMCLQNAVDKAIEDGLINEDSTEASGDDNAEQTLKFSIEMKNDAIE